MKTTKLSKRKVKVLKEHGRRETFWKITSPKLGGGSIRRFFSREPDADTYLRQQEIQIKNWGTAGASMDEKLRGAALRAQEILQPLGLDLVKAAQHYADYVTTTRGGILLTDAAERFIKSREGVEYSPTYRKALAHHLKHFTEAFPNRTSRDITPSEIDGFLFGCGAVESIKTYRKIIKALFNFLIEEEKCDKNPVRKGKTEEVAYSVEILTPEQCAKLLEAATPDTLPPLALAMFCGLRASEIERLDWARVNLTEGIVILEASDVKKTGSRRVVPLPEPCKKWLLPYAKTAGPIQPSDFRNKFDRVRVRAGFRPSFADRKDAELQSLLAAAKKAKVKLQDWPSNCLRHSAISYAMAATGDQSKVASWAGNSPAMIKKHYDSQALPSAAVKFYAIHPETPGNVLPMGQAKAA